MNAGRDLAGQHALVTGGSRGIGAAIAHRLSLLGAAVSIVARDGDVAAHTASKLPGEAVAFSGDVTQPDSVKEVFAAASTAVGLVDILINNVGAASTAPFLRTDEAAWEHMFRINLLPVRLCCNAALPGMLERGSGTIVNVASTAGLRGYPYVSAYVAAKHAVVGLTRALAAETNDGGVAVHAVCPGFVDTEMTRRSAQHAAERTGRPLEEVLDSYAASNAHRRLVTPDEVASAVGWLCSPEQNQSVVITVDGGPLDRSESASP